MDKNKLNINQNKNHKNKERKTTPQYNFKKDFLNNINFDKNKNEKIRANELNDDFEYIAENN